MYISIINKTADQPPQGKTQPATISATGRKERRPGERARKRRKGVKKSGMENHAAQEKDQTSRETQERKGETHALH